MKCDGCTVCCDLLPVKWLDKPPNTACKYCDNGCTIQDTKPSECKDYNCMYAQVDGVPVELRPDKSGMVFEKHSDNEILAIQDARFQKSKIAINQIQEFRRQGFLVIIVTSDYKRPTTWQPMERI
jgi:hypothetical protein